MKTDFDPNHRASSARGSHSRASPKAQPLDAAIDRILGALRDRHSSSTRAMAVKAGIGKQAMRRLLSAVTTAALHRSAGARS